MRVNTITIVLTIIKSSVHTAMHVNYATNSLQCTRKTFYFNFQVTSILE